MSLLVIPNQNVQVSNAAKLKSRFWPARPTKKSNKRLGEWHTFKLNQKFRPTRIEKNRLMECAFIIDLFLRYFNERTSQTRDKDTQKLWEIVK